MAGTKYCHLCRVDASQTHESSSGHRAAMQLASVAVERLGNHASEDFTKGDTETILETDNREVSFCVSCNATVPASKFTSHLHQRTHTLALLNEQSLEELVQQYIDKEDLKLLEASSNDHGDSGTSVNLDKALNTYTCHFCSLHVPFVFKAEHELGPRHRSSRALAVTVARRLADTLAPRKSGDKSKDTSGDKSKDTSEVRLKDMSDTLAPRKSGDTSKDASGDKKNAFEDRLEDISECKSKDASEDMFEDESKVQDAEYPKWNSKMMKKLLRTYTGAVIDDTVENTEAKPEPKKPKRLTAKTYFNDILPYLPYIGSFHTLIVDNTEFITIKIGTDILKVHVNNLNGLYNYGVNEECYMNCRLCDGFENRCYSCNGEQDKLHVMSLGHIRNVMAPMENVHLIRKIDETHSICALCNVHMPSHVVDNHIMKDPHHTTTLTEALERGKHFKDTKEQLKIMVYSPIKKPNVFMKPSQFNNCQTWPQNQAKFNTLFGSQNSAFGSGQISALGSGQTSAFGSGQTGAFGNGQTSAFGSVQNSVFGSQSAFGSGQNNAIGSGQKNVFGNGQNLAVQGQNLYSVTQNGAFGQHTTGSIFGGGNAASGAQNKATGFGTGQTTATVGAQNATFGAQNATFGAQGKGSGTAQNTPFCSTQSRIGCNVQNKSVFGHAQNSTVSGNAQNAVGAQNTATGFGTQNTAAAFFRAQNTAQNNAGFVSAQNTNAFSAQNKTQNNRPFGNTPNACVHHNQTSIAVQNRASHNQPSSNTISQKTNNFVNTPVTSTVNAQTDSGDRNGFNQTASQPGLFNTPQKADGKVPQASNDQNISALHPHYKPQVHDTVASNAPNKPQVYPPAALSVTPRLTSVRISANLSTSSSSDSE